MTRDLMFQDEIRTAVRDAYGSLPAGAGRAMAGRLYDDAELALVPDDAIAWSLGVGNPVRHADLRPGQVVLDVGCGGGIDTILAADAVGPTGRVIGLDTLEEMCARADAAAEQAGVADRCEFLHGEMEDIPLPDASIDTVISNGVINLSPRKSRALAEIARVLRPGGRLCVADLTVDEGELPPEIATSEAAWAGCIAGAVSESTMLTKLDNAGFRDVALSHRLPFSVDDVALYPLFSDEVVQLMHRLLSDDLRAEVAVGLIVRAVKPEA